MERFIKQNEHKEDQAEFNQSGIRGLLAKAMRNGQEAFIKEAAGGWNGELLIERPAEGSGPYLHFKVGFGATRYYNEKIGDDRSEPFGAEI